MCQDLNKEHDASICCSSDSTSSKCIQEEESIICSNYPLSIDDDFLNEDMCKIDP